MHKKLNESLKSDLLLWLICILQIHFYFTVLHIVVPLCWPVADNERTVHGTHVGLGPLCFKINHLQRAPAQLSFLACQGIRNGDTSVLCAVPPTHPHPPSLVLRSASPLPVASLMKGLSFMCSPFIPGQS